MNAVQAAAGALAVLVAAWPQLKSVVSVLPVRPSAPQPPTYAKAIADLASVRARLVATKKLAEDQKAAIDTLTLALVDGSDA